MKRLADAHTDLKNEIARRNLNTTPKTDHFKFIDVGFESLDSTKLKTLFDYNPTTGILKRKLNNELCVRKSGNFKPYVMVFNKRFNAALIILLLMDNILYKSVNYVDSNECNLKYNNLKGIL